MKKSYAIFRVQKLKQGRGKGTLTQTLKHLEHHAKSATISHPELSGKNTTKLYMTNDQAYKKRDELIKSHNKKAPRALRSDASIALEMLFSFSPEMRNRIDIQQWCNANMRFLYENFNSLVPVRVDLHMDEETPHMHVVAFSTTESGLISSREALGDRKHLSQLQDAYASCVASLGLSRGVSKELTRARHTSRDEWQRGEHLRCSHKDLADEILDR